MHTLVLNKSLVQRFEQLAVQMEVPDRNTVLLRSVPTNENYFNQRATSLMVKRPRAGLAYVVSVDESLSYQGANARLSSVFESGIRTNGWRTLLLAISPSVDLQGAVDGALRCIGFDGTAPEMPPSLVGEKEKEAPQASLLDQYGIDLTTSAAEDRTDRTVGREDEQLDVLAATLSLSQSRMPIIVGASGIGKTNLLHGIANRLLEVRPDRKMVVVNLNQMFAGVTFEGEFENLCAAMLSELAESPDTILALEHAELLLSARMPRIVSESLDSLQLSMIGTMFPEFATRIRAPLARRTMLVRLHELNRIETREILAAAAINLEKYHGIKIDPQMCDACFQAARELSGPNPSKSLAVLESAASKAALTGSEHLSLDDLHDAVRRLTRTAPAEDE